MPYSITTKDGITINNIPDDVAPDSQELKERVSRIRAGGGAAALEAPSGPSTTATGLIGAITRGAAIPAAGAAAGAALGAPFAGVGAIPGAIAGAGAATATQFFGDPIIGLVNRVLGTNYASPTQAMEQMLTRIGVAQPQTEAEKIVQATAAGASGAGGTAALGRTLQTGAGQAAPVTREVGRMLAAQPVTQAAGGAMAGAAAQAAQEMGAGPIGQLGAALAGGVAGATLATPRRVTPGLSQTTQEATQRGISVLTSDVAPPETFMGRTVQQIGERVPLAGTGPVRVAQQQSRIAAVRDVLRQYGADDAAGVSDDVMRDLAAKRSADLNKYTGAKSDVINRLDAKGIVPVNNATQAIDTQIAELQSLRSEQYLPVIRVLEDWKSSLQNQSLANIEKLRKQVGESFAAPELASIRDTGQKALSKVYGPLKQDMEDFITQVGERRDVTKWKVADKRLAQMAGELDMGTLKSVLRSGSVTPEDVNKLIFSKKPSEIRQLYSDLTPAGRASVRTAVLSRAASSARYNLEDGTVAFSPEKFNAEIQRLQPQIGVFFKGDDLKQVEGLSKALTLTRRAGQAGVATATGQQAVPFVAGSFLVDLLGSFGASLAAAGGVGLTARIYESGPVRNLMLQLGRAAPGSAEEAAISKRLIAAIQTQAESQQSSQELER